MADYTHTVYTLMKPSGVFTNQTLEQALVMFHTGAWIDVTKYKTEKDKQEKDLQTLYEQRFKKPEAAKASIKAVSKKGVKKCRKVKKEPLT